MTTAETGWKAMSLLRDETKKFDLLLVEVHLPNESNFTLLYQAIGKGIPTIYKPIAVEVLKNLWKHAIKDETNKAQNICVKVKSNVVEVIIGNKSEGSFGKGASNGGIKRKTYIRWTERLHRKFMEAIHQLGDDNCYPKEILELMNEPGLTRMQVASHLQKCRMGLWRGSKSNRVMTRRYSERKEGKRKYGAVPIFENSSNTPQLNQPPESYELSPFGSYFGVDHPCGTPSETLNFEYQLPEMNDNLSFSHIFGVPPLKSNFLDQTQGGR